MLHPLNPLDRVCEDNLLALIEWQRKTLLYARDHDQFRSDTFRRSMGDNFADWFEDSRVNGHQDQKKAFNNFQQNLNALTKCDLTKKQMVIADFEYDQDFYLHLYNHDFIFAFSPQISTAHKKAQVCLNSFYEFLTWGFPATLTVSHRYFHRQDIVQSYLDHNPILLNVCPCCDNSWPEPSRAGGKPQTLEHFFHKEEHPTICLHPYNLIPVCGVCNGRRGNKEMLSPNGDADLAIDQIFHPIERPVRKYAQLEFRSHRLEPEIMSFVNLPTRIDDWQTAIDAYEAVYAIPSRWRVSWTEIQHVASRAIYYRLHALRSVGVTISRDRFSQELEQIERILMQDYGRYQYSASRWLAWAKTNYFELLYKTHVESRLLDAQAKPFKPTIYAAEPFIHRETRINSQCPILFLAADPTDTSRIRLGEELREIQEKLQLAKLREQFELHQRMSVRPADISQALLDVQPKIVHFSGHGGVDGALYVENQVGETHPIQPDILGALFEQFASQIHCVLLNACYSENQANVIAKHINYVIGMSQAIGDKAAIAFTIGFYQALGAGRTIEDAYKLGCVQISLQGISEHLTPVLIKKG